MFLDLAVFKKMGHSKNFADTICLIFSWILFWNIEKWIAGQLGQANTPLPESNTLSIYCGQGVQ